MFPEPTSMLTQTALFEEDFTYLLGQVSEGFITSQSFCLILHTHKNCFSQMYRSAPLFS